MFDIQRKDMPLKGLLTTYEIRIDDPIMDKEIKKVIDKKGDRQNHKTNVKAQMTEWKMWHEPSFKKIEKYVDSKNDYFIIRSTSTN